MKTQILSIILALLLITNIFLASAVTIKDVTSYPDEVAPGEVFSVSIEIENIHTFDIENINVKLILTQEKGETNPLTGIAETLGANLPFAPYQSSSEEFLDELRSDEEEDFKFKLIVLPDTASGVYKIPVEITYEDDDGDEREKDELISVIVNSKPELKVSFEDNGVLIKGKENIFSIKIINSGLADVKFLYMKVNKVSGLNFVSEREQYVGDVDSDDFDSVEYKVYIDDDALNRIRLPVILKFRDATNKEFTETKDVYLDIYSLKQAQELGLVAKPSYTYYILAGIVVVFYFGYRIRKKRKMKKLRGGR